MPITWITSLVGSLALIGTPFFSGFYSKDSIIDAVKLSHLPGSGFAYFAVVASVFVTALYSFRMYFLVFHGEERFRKPKHPESPMGMAAAHGHDDHGHGHGHDDHAHEPHETPWVVGAAGPAGDPVGHHRRDRDQPDAVRRLLPARRCIRQGDLHRRNHPALAEMAEEFHGWVGMGLHSVSACRSGSRSPVSLSPGSCT